MIFIRNEDRNKRYSDEETLEIAKKYKSSLKSLVNIMTQKKQLETQEKIIKTSMIRQMMVDRISGFSGKTFSLKRNAAVAPGMSVDLRALEKNEPDLYNMLLVRYPKKVSGHTEFISVLLKNQN